MLWLGKKVSMWTGLLATKKSEIVSPEALGLISLTFFREINGHVNECFNVIKNKKFSFYIYISSHY